MYLEKHMLYSDRFCQVFSSLYHSCLLSSRFTEEAEIKEMDDWPSLRVIKNVYKKCFAAEINVVEMERSRSTKSNTGQAVCSW